MSDERHQGRVAINKAQPRGQDSRDLGSQNGRDGSLDEIESGPLTKTRRRAMVLGVLAAVALAAVGATLWANKAEAPPPGMSFVVIDDPKEVLAYIHAQQLPPATEQQRIEQVQHQELVVWRVRQFSGFQGQEGEVFTLDNGVDSHQYAIASGGQSFEIFAEKTTTSFKFYAGANPSHGRMTGTWSTPAGATNYNMNTGDSIDVKVQ